MTTIIDQSFPLISASFTKGETHLLIGTGSSETPSLSSKRIRTILNSGANPIIVHPSTQCHFDSLSKQFVNETGLKMYNRETQLSDLTSLGRLITSKIVDRVYVNLPFEQSSIQRDIFEQCQKLRIPINTYQQPEYSTFSMLPTYIDPKGSGLQITVTANGCGYVLANRIKREIINNLPSNISQIVTNMANLRNQIIAENNESLLKEKLISADFSFNNLGLGFGLDDDVWESHKLNKVIHEYDVTKRSQQTKRTRWLSQVMEYYPLAKLEDITLEELEKNPTLAESNPRSNSPGDKQGQQPLQKSRRLNQNGFKQQTESIVSADLKVLENNKKGSISLVGSGPGSVSMLTIGALNEIKTADIILADKLVPQTVLDLIPKNTETFIARKFPGNAERAQQELLEKGIIALKQNKKVVRLKQGDPYIFGRGGEEFLYFKENGFEPTVLPGLSSSLTATVVAKIPATHRGVADQVLVCTGTGRKGVLPKIPEYVETRTTIFLMALHRADVLTKSLIEMAWDPEVPVAIVERASCPDQRVTRTLLKYLPSVIEEIGSRPPGLLVIGKAVSSLISDAFLDFNDDHKFYIEEGYHDFEVNTADLIKA